MAGHIEDLFAKIKKEYPTQTCHTVTKFEEEYIAPPEGEEED